MNESTATRTLDELGRIVIPKDIRTQFGWKEGTTLEIAVQDIGARAIIIREVLPHCSLCLGQAEDLQKVGCGHICKECAGKIKP